VAEDLRRGLNMGVAAFGARHAVVLAGLWLSLALPVEAGQTFARAPEPNSLVPPGVMRYAPSGFPDRIVASPAQDASRGSAVAWRTDATIDAPLLEIAVAGDSPDLGEPRRVVASTRALRSENGLAHHHRA